MQFLFVCLLLSRPYLIAGVKPALRSHGRMALGSAPNASIDSAPGPGLKCSVLPWTGGGVPVAKSLPPLPKYLALKHVQKAGGSFMTDLLIEMTKGLPNYFPRYRGFFRLIEEQIAVQSVARDEQENRDLFVISSVRNPCDWYVSLWAYTSQWDPRLNDMVASDAGEPKAFYDLNGNTNATKFNSWLHWAQGLWDKPTPQVSDSAVGLMTTRYWESFASGKDSGCWYSSDPRGACPGSCTPIERPGPREGWTDGIPDPEVSEALLEHGVRQVSALQTQSTDSSGSGCGNCYDSVVTDKLVKHLADRPEVRAEMDKFNPNSHVDCWVTNENLMPDLERCLKEYERQSGVALDWEPFRNPPPQRATNKSPRNKCEYYYTPELEKLVLERDHHMFDKFGYGTCCGPQTRFHPRNP